MPLRSNAPSTRSFLRLSSPNAAMTSAKFGEIPEELWVDCVISSNADRFARARGHTHPDLLCAVRSLSPAQGQLGREPRTAGRSRDSERSPNTRRTCPSSILARQVLTPLDLERTYGLPKAISSTAILRLEQLFFMRPVSGWSQYRTPIDGLYLCGAGAHPGGGVTGAPGHNAAHQVLRDWKKGRLEGGCRMSNGPTGLNCVERHARHRHSDSAPAGVMGASIAFHLAQRKAGKIRRHRQRSRRPRRQRPLLRAGSHALQLSAGSPTGAREPAHVRALARTWWAKQR